MLESYRNPASREHFQAPEGLPHHREGRSPIADHRGSGGILDRCLGPPEILGELRPAEPRDHLMVVPVAGNLMALSLDVRTSAG